MGQHGLHCPWCGVDNLWEDIRANGGHMHCCAKAGELGDVMSKTKQG